MGQSGLTHQSIKLRGRVVFTSNFKLNIVCHYDMRQHCFPLVCTEEMSRDQMFYGPYATENKSADAVCVYHVERLDTES